MEITFAVNFMGGMIYILVIVVLLLMEDFKKSAIFNSELRLKYHRDSPVKYHRGFKSNLFSPVGLTGDV